MKQIVIAFSGGLESTYIAQKMLQKGNNVTLVYGRAAGAANSYQEASLVYNVYLKLQDLFQDRKVNLVYNFNTYFQTSSTRHNEPTTLSRLKLVNQQMRVACMMIDAQSYIPADAYMIGWTHNDTYEDEFTYWGYTEQDYRDLKNLPVLLNRFTRSTSLILPIICPVWDMKKNDIYSELLPELRDVLVLNSFHGSVTEAKLEEYRLADIPLPKYLGNEGKDLLIEVNDFGRYFFNMRDWWVEISGGEKQKAIPEGLHDTLRFLTPMVLENDRTYLTSEIMLEHVTIFRNTITKIISAYL